MGRARVLKWENLCNYRAVPHFPAYVCFETTLWNLNFGEFSLFKIIVRIFGIIIQKNDFSKKAQF